MTVVPLPTAGNSSKFHVKTERGDFIIALSYTLRTKVWQLLNDDAELGAATGLAEAIILKHNSKYPYKPLYVFAEHNTASSVIHTVEQIKKNGIK